MAALSQLSYGPKLIVAGPVYKHRLVVSRRIDAEVERGPPGRFVSWHRKHAVKLRAVDGQEVDLLEAVLGFAISDVEKFCSSRSISTMR